MLAQDVRLSPESSGYFGLSQVMSCYFRLGQVMPGYFRLVLGSSG
jgi:hypothetical protein